MYSSALIFYVYIMLGFCFIYYNFLCCLLSCRYSRVRWTRRTCTESLATTSCSDLTSVDRAQRRCTSSSTTRATTSSSRTTYDARWVCVQSHDLFVKISVEMLCMCMYMYMVNFYWLAFTKANIVFPLCSTIHNIVHNLHYSCALFKDIQ